MCDINFRKQGEIWGQAYEIMVKMGVITCLHDHHLLSIDTAPQIQQWRSTTLSEVNRSVIKELKIIDENLKQITKSALRNLAVNAAGTGYTVMREYLKPFKRHIEKGYLRLEALWCPLVLPGCSGQRLATLEEELKRFTNDFGLPLMDRSLLRQGYPVNSDFTLWLSSTRRNLPDQLLIQEYSYAIPPQTGDYRHEHAHLEEALRYGSMIEARSVFAKVNSEVEGESFDLSEDICNHLGALTSKDKPFYKLCQAASYAHRTYEHLERTQRIKNACSVRAIAITPIGLESLQAEFNSSNHNDAGRKLMLSLGRAYREMRKTADDDTQALDQKIKSFFGNICNRLPHSLKMSMRMLNNRIPEPSQPYQFLFSENITNFSNPAGLIKKQDAINLIEDTPALESYFGKSAKEAISIEIENRIEKDSITLRNLHASAVVAGLKSSKKGKLNVLALEGNPGIGKTTALKNYLEKTNGFFFLYLSPRVVINRDVTKDLARNSKGLPTGVLTVTTNSTIINNASKFHADLVQCGEDEARYIDGAVVADGYPDLKKPKNSFLILTPEQEEQMDINSKSSSFTKHTTSENEDIILERKVAAVLSCLTLATRELLTINPEVNRLVLTAQLQAFRGNLDSLSKLFKGNASDNAGKKSRLEFAKRMPNIVVMVDELAGDGAGAPFVNEVATWLNEQFIQAFDGNSPFTVTLVLADASLSNDIVLSRYVTAGHETPDKVLLSKSKGNKCFDISVNKITLGDAHDCSVLHIMTNSFPASSLSIDYVVGLEVVEPKIMSSGKFESARKAIQRIISEKEKYEAPLAATKIIESIEQGAVQVIYFAQNKALLVDLKEYLSGTEELSNARIEILDQSIPTSKKQEILKPENRDSTKVFLMTSSGARGISFPKTDTIIASIPRFNIESSLMEVAQLIYRGRGGYKSHDGKFVSGDHAQRKLIMLLDEYIIKESNEDSESFARKWIRQSINLMTLLVMLRSTIHTRITGDAGLKQPFALVPVGGTGTQSVNTSMSSSVSLFIKEARLHVARCRDKAQKGLLQNAIEGVTSLFSRLDFKTQLNHNSITASNYDHAKEINNFFSNPSMPLARFNPNKPALPEDLYISGNSFLEDWRKNPRDESFGFEAHTPELDKKLNDLLSQLYVINQDKYLPNSVRIPASNLLRILDRGNDEIQRRTYNVLKSMKGRAWIAIPTGYPQFIKYQDGIPKTKLDPENLIYWKYALLTALNSGSNHLPAIEKYKLMPWAASLDSKDPLRFKTTFDNRYFYASNELNLLNTLLLAEE